VDGERLADAARSALDWIGSVAVEVDGGRIWQEDGTPVDDLYAGTAGVLLGCAEATAAGLDAAPVAAGARDRLLHLAHHPDAAILDGDGAFTGWAGVAVALRAWARAAGDRAAADGADRVLATVAGRAGTPPAADGCTDIISGDAGILLTLLDTPDQPPTDQPGAGSGPAGQPPTDLPGAGSGPAGQLSADLPEDRLAAVELLADRLVAVAEPDPHGLQWRMDVGRNLMPGFSHGTAGVAYALVVAGRALGRADLVTAAVRGAEALLAAGHQPGGWALPVTVPPRPDVPLAYGWCHGPSGTVRLFTLLDEIDPAPRWRDAAGACLRALRDSRLPARLYPGYWDNLARCCGTAGVGQLLLDRYQATGDTTLLDWTDTLAADVLDRAVPTPHGLTWSNTEHKNTPPDLPPEPGFMQGAAGIAGWLSRLHALHAGRTAARPGPRWL
jgi:lantibiotic modifying enzyme